MKVISFAKTDIGKTRRNNEDSYLLDDGIGLYAVADGIGGHQGGEVASALAIETLAQAVKERLNSNPFLSSTAHGGAVDPNFLQDGFSLANAKIIGAAEQDHALARMGTTMTALFVRKEAVYLAHVGDSRAYRLSAGKLTQISEDHSVVGEQIRMGLLSHGQARNNPYRHIITRALGIERHLPVDLLKIAPRLDDLFLLCTDGLTEMVDDSEIEKILDKAAPRDAGEKLVALANERGGVDNITVVVIKIASLE